MTEAAVHMGLMTLTKAFRRKFDPGMVKLYHKALDGRAEDHQLDRALQEMLENEERFPTIATVLRYCRGEAKATTAGDSYLRGTQIRTRDFTRDHNQYAAELCERGGFWKDADEQRRYERAAQLMPRAAHAKVPMQDYLKAIAEIANMKQDADAQRQSQPGNADRTNRQPRKKVRHAKWEAPF